MANPVGTTDLELRWRSLSPGESIVAGTMLDDAWQILLARVPGIETRLADATLSTELVTAVECAMVLRVLRNPGGKAQETIDDYSYVRDTAVSTGALYLADDEAALLSPAGDTGTAFTITPVGEPGYAATWPINWFELNV